MKGLDNKKTNDVPMHIDDLRRTMPSNHEVRPKVIEISKGYRGDGDGDIGETSSKVYMLKQGHHGPDKLKLLKTRGVQGEKSICIQNVKSLIIFRIMIMMRII